MTETLTPAATATPTATEGAAPKAMSFRDMGDASEIDQATGVKPKAEPKKEAPPAKDEDDDSDDDLDDDEDDDGDEEEEGSEDEDSSDDEDDDEDSEEDDDEDDDGDEETTEFSAEQLAKEFDKDGKTAVKVDGKVRKYTLQELKNIASSGAHTLERANAFKEEVETTRRTLGEHKAELLLANEKITPAWKPLKEGKIEESFLALAEAANLSTLDVKRKLLHELTPAFLRRYGITEEVAQKLLKRNEGNIKLDETHEENEFLKRRGKRQAEQAQKPEPQPEEIADQELKAGQLQYGISDSLLQYAKEFALETLAKDGSVTTGQVIQVARNKLIVDKAFEAVRASKPKLQGNDKFMDRVIRYSLKNPDMSLAETVRFVKKQARKLAGKAKEQETAKLTQDISRKALRGKDKSGFENPSSEQKKKLSFRDYGDDELA